MPHSNSGLIRSWNNFLNAFRLAMDSIRAQKLRSFLTLLGVIIGVASVIMVGAAIEGLSVYAEQSTAKAFGSESLLVAQIAATGRLSRRELFDKLKRNKPIRTGDARFLESFAGDRVLYSPYRQHISDVKRENLICEDSSVLGAASAMSNIRDIGVVDGRFFTEQEERSAQPVAVIGSEVGATLFPTTDPLGHMVTIKGLAFTVVGVVEKLGSAFGNNQDNVAYIPFPVYSRIYGFGQSIAIFGRSRPGTNLSVESALDMTRVALRTRFHARPGHSDRFDSLTPEAMQGFINQLVGMISAVVVPVTLISLVVGGIVIMNIMLVSVTERTREIGVRRSLGARQKDIRRQFLIEAVILAGLGGAMGVAVGASLTLALAKLAGLTLTITVQYVLLGLATSASVGVVSGWFPARRASRLDPVAALRAE